MKSAYLNQYNVFPFEQDHYSVENHSKSNSAEESTFSLLVAEVIGDTVILIAVM